jgi:hypothetical protein
MILVYIYINNQKKNFGYLYTRMLSLSRFDVCIALIFILKITFIVLAVMNIYTKITTPENTERLNNLQFWKDRVEFVFIFTMSSLLLFLFNPFHSHIGMITKETKMLLFLFGCILIVTAQWGLFISQAPWVKDIRNSLGNEGSV